MEKQPKVSLVMKVYNGETYLREAIDSILQQTFQDFELVIIDDGSTDGSAGIIKSYADKRIRFLKNDANLGLCATQNKVIAAARGEYIAVMDCDDISYPTRFEKQVAYLEKHSEVMMCGCLRDDIVDGKVTSFRPGEHPDNRTLKFSLVFGNYYLTHSSIMFRAKEYREAGLQYGGVPVAEDYQMIVEMAKRYEIALLPEALVAYRIYPQSTSKIRAREITQGAASVKCGYLEELAISREEKQCLLEYFQKGKAKGELELFLQAVEHVAKLLGAEIGLGGNANPVACEIVKEYLMRQAAYDMKLRSIVKKSDFAAAISLNQVFGWKLLAACLLHVKR